MKNKPELLAPAGNFNKLKTAFHFGADAAYIGGKDFSLRSYADNFSDGELAEAIEYAHNLGKKVYVTVNIFAKNQDFEKAEKYFRFLNENGADGVIITDPGLIALSKKTAPELPIHLSTQANTLNKYAARFWAEQGVKRIVTARELSLQELMEITSYNKDTEFEAFVHGAMCVSYSGRCLLSNYLANRDANRGQCVQTCRWSYRLLEQSRHAGEPLDIEEDERGTYILNSKDLNLLENIGDLNGAGIVSFKIEGRMKSEFYIASVVNAYRRAIDEYFEYGRIKNLTLYKKELNGVSHRRYTKAYLLGDNGDTISLKRGCLKATANL